MNDRDVLQAVRELAEIRRAVEKNRNSPPKRGRAQAAMLVTGLLVASALLIWELTRVFGPTQFLIETHFREKLRYLAIFDMGVCLAILLSGLSFLFLLERRSEQETFEAYLARSFSFLNLIAFLSDLFVKFATVSLIILAGRPDWVAPLLLVFLGDYLIQGRFFVFPIRLAYLLGMVAIGLGVLQCLLWYGSLVLPLAVFIGLSACSLLFLLSASRHGNVE